MKKTLIIVAILGLVVSGLAFCQEKFAVQSVSGRVEQEVSPGKWVLVKVGETLGEKAVIRTGVNALLVVKAGDRIISIKGAQNGLVRDFASSNANSGISLGGMITETNTAVIEKSTGTISTATARADEAEIMELAE
jgi:hypothetical protein